MEKLYHEHNPETVCLIGMGPSIQDFLTETLTQELRPDHHDEVWGINMVGNALRCDLIFWLDDLTHQKSWTPHKLTPTVMVKHLFSQPLAEEMAKHPDIAEFIATVQSLPEKINTLEYHAMSNRFSDLFKQHLVNAPIGILLEATRVMDEELKTSHPDQDRSLEGLMKMLDRHKTPVITSVRHPEVIEKSFDYPIQECGTIGIDAFGKPYLCNGVVMAISYAIHKKVKTLKIYGCDFTYPDRNFAEEGRGATEAWIALANLRHGMKVEVAPHSSLFDNARDKGIYGFADQPAILLENGKVFQYQKTGQQIDENGTPYVPEDSSGVKHAVPAAVPRTHRRARKSRANGADRSVHSPDEAGAAP